MKKFTSCLTATVCVVGMLAVAVQAAPPARSAKDLKVGAETKASKPGSVLQVGPLIETTGFEGVDGWVPRDGINNGFICGVAFAACTAPVSGACPDPGGNCCIDDPNPDNGWYVSISSMHCREPHIDTVNPAGGSAQHLRFQRAGGEADGHYGDTPGCVGFSGACRVSAFTPLAVGDGPLTVGPTTTEFDLYASATFSSQFALYEVAESSGNGIAGYTYFAYWGYIYGYQPGIAFHYVGLWDTGQYQHLQIRHDPCNDSLTYAYGGVDLLTTDLTNHGLWVSRAIMQTDNAGEIWDVDNFAITRGEACPTTCGADGIEAGEDCDFGVDEDANCPGRCVEPGGTGPNGEPECTCVLEGLDPCSASDLPNGTTDIISHGGWFTFVADTEATAVEACGSTGFDSYMAVFTNADGSDDCSAETGLDTQLAGNDDCDVNSGCCGADADPLASCHPVGSPWESCTCIPTVIGQRYWVWEASGGGVIGGNIVLTKSKRQDCGAVWEGGACCDGVSGTCSDNVLPGDCAGEFDTFTLNKYCDGLTCEPVTGSCCDSAPGLGGACTDDVINADCQGQYQTWTGNARCDICEEITGACCDPLDGFCSVTLQGDCTAAHPNGPVWTAGATCGQVSCDPALGACCNTRLGTCTDNVTLADCGGENFSWTKGEGCSAETCPDPFIPTVSQWGLVIMTLLLLIGAKVYFGRREALA